MLVVVSSSARGSDQLVARELRRAQVESALAGSAERHVHGRDRGAGRGVRDASRATLLSCE